MSALFDGTMWKKHLEAIRNQAVLSQRFRVRRRSSGEEQYEDSAFPTSPKGKRWCSKATLHIRKSALSEDDYSGEEHVTDSWIDTYVRLEREVWLDLNTPLSQKSSKISAKLIRLVFFEVQRVFFTELAKTITEMLFWWSSAYTILEPRFYAALGFSPSGSLMLVEAPNGRAKERFVNRHKGRKLLKEYYINCLWESIKTCLEEKIFSQMLKAEEDVIRRGTGLTWAGVELNTYKKMKVWPRWVLKKLTKLFPGEFDENTSSKCLKHFAEEIEYRLVKLVNEAECGVKAEIKHSDNNERDGVSVSWTL